MTPEEKIDEMRDLLHEMKPMLASVVSGQADLEKRIRASEIQATVHGVKIDQVEKDIVGLHGRISSIRSQPGPGGPAGAAGARGATGPVGDTGRSGDGKLIAIIEFLTDVPRYWHVIASVGMTVIALAAMLWRHLH